MKDFIKQILRGLLPVTSEPQNPKGGWPAQKSLPSVDVLIDVGIGQQGTPGLYENINASSFIFIDPIQECEQAVQTLLADNKNNMFICCALGEKNTTDVLNVFENMFSRSSFDEVLSSNRDGTEIVSKRVVEVKRLDDLKPIQTAISGKSFGIKIDVEGHEAPVIKGGQQTTALAEFIILEMPVGPKRFKRDLWFHEYIGLMSEFGFYVHSLRMGKGNGQGHCDIAFLKKRYFETLHN